MQNNKSKTKKLPFGEIAIGGNGDFALLTSNGDGITKGTSFTTNLNPLLKKLLEGSNVHNLVFNRLRAIDHEACYLLLSLRSAHFRASEKQFQFYSSFWYLPSNENRSL
jgi:hypothetical protein